MCSTVEDMGHRINSIFYNFWCNITDEECTSVRCDNPTYSVSMYVTPCDAPPSLQFNVYANGHTQIIFTTGNQTTTLSVVNGTLNITMWHFDYSMDVSVSIIMQN